MKIRFKRYNLKNALLRTHSIAKQSVSYIVSINIQKEKTLFSLFFKCLPIASETHFPVIEHFSRKIFFLFSFHNSFFSLSFSRREIYLICCFHISALNADRESNVKFKQTNFLKRLTVCLIVCY